MDKKALTVFTPAYNRADTIVRTYESLLRQTNKNFEWIIVDDGSTDNTEEVVKPWLDAQLIPIRYIKKKNGGLFTGYNTAIEHCNTELNVCIDSDDYMPDDAVEIILEEWSKVGDPNIAGLIGLDYKINGNPIGGMFSKEGDYYYREKFNVVNHYCDTKVVCRTDLMKAIWPMPSFGEKDFNPTWYYCIIGEEYKFRLINKCLCIVDYQPDGMMAGIFRQYRNSPKSIAEMRRVTMRSKYTNYKEKTMAAIHYISSSIFARDRKFLQKSPKPILTFFVIPLGLILHGYIHWKLWKHRKKTFKI